MKILFIRAALRDVIALSHSRKRINSSASSVPSETSHYVVAQVDTITTGSNLEISRNGEDKALSERMSSFIWKISTKSSIALSDFRSQFQYRVRNLIIDERGDVPGWVLVVLMTTGLVTGIWTVAAPRIESLLRGSLDSMNNVR